MIDDEMSKLIIDNLRNIKSHTIPPYESELIEEIFNETGRLLQLINDLGSLFPRKNTCHMKQNCTIAHKVLVESILRNKRLLLVYHNTRIDAMANTLWDGLSLPVTHHLTVRETKFLENLTQLVKNLSDNLQPHFELVTTPPTFSMTHVLLTDELDVAVRNSFNTLKEIPKRCQKNSLHLMSEKEANRLIKLGLAAEL
eukprot:gnl/MRDRNA2_/MRDRNA2_84795_c1_seq1.p2 gnl/MRDRNA2_/MRDRNA2_84795_c1~~gnl/MRDRNA2_/MRDRNA2_84795_c1_seq1.p2  ORF type:complete len:198 (-),score=4.39 gnl/MRDRNA2_/MRDRNA2_84795_c1_seq1:79-672(-)